MLTELQLRTYTNGHFYETAPCFVPTDGPYIYSYFNHFPKNTTITKARPICPNRDLTQNTTATAMKTSPNKRFNEHNNSCARAV